MMYERIRQQLDASSTGLVSRELCDKVGVSATAENIAMVDIICELSPAIVVEDGHWRASGSTKTKAVLAALRNHAQTTGKSIFRASSALAGLPVEQQPTQEELASIVEMGHGHFQLLPNNMIKANR